MANRNRQRRAVPPDQVATQPQFPVVGSGASAGGFESFKVILENLPATPGLALVHEQLYKTKDLARLNFAEYASGLLRHLWQASRPAAQVKLEPAVTPVLLPVGMDWRATKSLGLHLVQLLAGQMHGTVELGPGPGTEFRVTFPNPGVTQ